MLKSTSGSFQAQPLRVQAQMLPYKELRMVVLVQGRDVHSIEVVVRPADGQWFRSLLELCLTSSVWWQNKDVRLSQTARIQRWPFPHGHRKLLRSCNWCVRSWDILLQDLMFLSPATPAEPWKT
ncbi:hypothetical protein PBY51_019501 [Eleginops maclovinus]|uniref:Uncharacterized protein n=1 Tax=Eleginops maclovinus TaxID=56733 RepID=A0AAN7Y6U9_ELEMC|nr:hypothetical protein PBY51_019501 [Eleginops maclovinus]